VHPLTNRAYVLLPADLYQRVPGFLESQPARGGPPPTGPAPAPATVQPPAEVRPMRQRLGDLPTPPEVAEEARQYCRRLGLFRRRCRDEVLEELKLQYYFGGQYIGYLRTDTGKVIVAAGALYDVFDRQLAFVSPEERRRVILYAPYRWHDEVSVILTPHWHED
jgi:hypothetical protein